MSRKPKPVSLRVIEGNPGKRPLPAKKPAVPDKAAMPAPTGLSVTARKEWERVVPLLQEKGLLERVDEAGLHRYCEACARAAAADRFIHKHGVMIRGERGMVKNPACQIARDASAEMKAWCVEFGMTPSSRGRMVLPEDEGDELERLISRRG